MAPAQPGNHDFAKSAFPHGATSQPCLVKAPRPDFFQPIGALEISEPRDKEPSHSHRGKT
jgi:hypothetical protein